MPLHNYELWLTKPDGTKIDIVNRVGKIEYTMAINDVGTFSIEFNTDIDKSLLGIFNGFPDRRIEIWRSAKNVKKTLQMIGFIRKTNLSVSKNGTPKLVVSGYDQNELLRRRIVAYASGESQASKTDYADDMMKEIVAENLGSSATDGNRNLTSLGFSVQSDSSSAPQITKAFSYINVLEVLQDIAEASEKTGTRLYFRVVPVASDSIEFRTYIDQPGNNRTSGSNQVIFSPLYGNISDIELEVNHTEEINYVYAGGQGVGSGREVQEILSQERINASIWNRCETFQDSRNSEASDAVKNSGMAALQEGMPYKRLEAELQDTDQTRYGKDWQFGDKVAVSYFGIQLDALIDKIKIRVDENGRERIDTKAIAYITESDNVLFGDITIRPGYAELDLSAITPIVTIA